MYDFISTSSSGGGGGTGGGNNNNNRRKIKFTSTRLAPRKLTLPSTTMIRTNQNVKLTGQRHNNTKKNEGEYYYCYYYCYYY